MHEETLFQEQSNMHENTFAQRVNFSRVEKFIIIFFILIVF